ncbi:thioredoxin reductase [Firmicutes bacterium CAG:341]|uniref:NAD(P)/FAD-dependent oxidoreductase n=1 Tax=Eubacterium sp. TaxID=142586 RepID=UPI000340FCEC|nr:thioredoxin reductase [Firmicutes bacterium CAG:341]
MRYDIAIIGTGPAGISAAITAKLRNKNIILFGNKDLSDKINKAHSIKNYTGLPNVTGEELATALKNHLNDLDIEITEKRVNAVYSMGEYFALQVGKEMIESKSLIIATGVTALKTLENEDEFLGRGVSYCATCDAHFCKGKDVAVIAYTKEAEEDALFLSEVCSSIKYFPLYDISNEIFDKYGNIQIIKDKPIGFAGNMKAEKIICENSSYDAFSTFVVRNNISADKLVPGLKTDGTHIIVDLQMETNIKGLFACGDIAGKPYQYIKSAGQGNIAALSAIAYLANKSKGE